MDFDERLQSLLDALPVGLFEGNAKGELTYVNDTAAKLAGLPRDRVLGNDWLELVPDEDRDRVRADFKRLQREPLRYEHRYRGNGRLSWLLVEGGPIEGGFFGTLTDITDIKRREAAVQESERRFRQLAELLPETVFEFDARGVITYVNAAGYRMSGYGPDDLEAGFEMIRIIAERDRERAMNNLTQALRGGEARPNEYELRRKDGSTFPAVIHFATLVDKGAVLGGQGIIVDLTDVRSAERKRTELEDQLRRAQETETLGALAGGVAHDMNNVLTVIASLASVTLREAEQGTVVSSDMRSVLSACERGQSLTRNLLGFARRGKYRAQRFSVNKAIDDVVRLLRRTIPKGIAIEVDLADDLLMVVGDVQQIGHVLLNLAINAVDAMGAKGTLRFETALVEITEGDRIRHPKLEAGPHVRLRVVDDGAGMEANVATRAFEPFFSTKNPSQGTGLGLSMVYGTVRSHHGDTILESELGLGTAVTIHLPTVEPSIDEDETPMPERVQLQREGTVLLVDDDPLIRKSGRRLLRTLGFRVLVAADGREAEAVFREHHEQVALVILDLMMPVMDGQEAFRALREIDPQARIMISSGFASGEVAGTLVEMGALGFLEKPYTLGQLSDALSMAVPTSENG